MGKDAPTPVVLPIHRAPGKAPCPQRGKHGRRTWRLPPRRVRSVMYKTVAYLEITCGEYRARCDCRTTFRKSPEQVLPRALYDNKVRDAVRRLRSAMARRGKAGRKKERGRKGARSKAAAPRRGMTVEEKAHFVFERRHLVVKRREDLTEAERDDLIRMLEYLSELATLRRSEDRTYWLFDTPKDVHQASGRRAAIVRDAAFQAVPELARALKRLDEERFPKLMAHLANPVRCRPDWQISCGRSANG